MVHSEETGKSALHRVTEWNHSYLVSNIVTSGERLLVSDYLNSVSVLKFKDESKTRLETVARDYTPLMPLTIEAFEEKSILGADVSALRILLRGGCSLASA